MRSTKKSQDKMEKNKRIDDDEKYAKIIKALEDYKNEESEIIKNNADKRIEKMKERIKLEKEEKMRRIEEDSNIEQERMEIDIRKQQEKEIKIVDEYVKNEIAKIDARKRKEILSKKIMEIENYESIPLNEDSENEGNKKNKKKKEGIIKRKIKWSKILIRQEK